MGFATSTLSTRDLYTQKLLTLIVERKIHKAFTEFIFHVERVVCDSFAMEICNGHLLFVLLAR